MMLLVFLTVLLLVVAGLTLVLDLSHDGLGRRPGPRSHPDPASELPHRLR